jgi:hypothetical protein
MMVTVLKRKILSAYGEGKKYSGWRMRKTGPLKKAQLHDFSIFIS